MHTMVTYACQHCGGPYQRRKGDAHGKFCSIRCSVLVNKPSQVLLIPDGAPMSIMTAYRRRRAAGLVKPINPKPFNERLFDEWSDWAAWMLGLIWSDGCLFGNIVEICSKDLQLIDLVMAVMEGGSYNLKNQGKHLRVTFTSKHAASRLRELGLTEHKSLTIAWPADIAPAYEGAFVRGLIDGDGSVFLRQERRNQQVADLHVQLVTASPYLKDGIQAWLEREGIQYGLSVRTPPQHLNYAPLWKFAIHHHSSLRKLHSLLYPDLDIPCLHRKRIPYEVWMQTPRARTGRIKQACHLALDLDDHIQHAKETRSRKRREQAQASGQLELF